MKLFELLENEGNFCRGAFARDAEGNDVYPNDIKATKWCVLGGLRKCYLLQSDYWQALSRIRRVLKNNNVGYCSDRMPFKDIRSLILAADV